MTAEEHWDVAARYCRRCGSDGVAGTRRCPTCNAWAGFSTRGNLLLAPGTVFVFALGFLLWEDTPALVALISAAATAALFGVWFWVTSRRAATFHRPSSAGFLRTTASVWLLCMSMVPVAAWPGSEEADVPLLVTVLGLCVTMTLIAPIVSIPMVRGWRAFNRIETCPACDAIVYGGAYCTFCGADPTQPSPTASRAAE